MSNIVLLFNNLIVLFFFLGGMVAFLWTLIGIIPGFIFLVLALTNKDHAERKKFIKWTCISFGGFALLLIIIALFIVFLIISNLLGLNNSPITQNTLPTY